MDGVRGVLLCPSLFFRYDKRVNKKMLISNVQISPVASDLFVATDFLQVRIVVTYPVVNMYVGNKILLIQVWTMSTSYTDREKPDARARHVYRPRLSGPCVGGPADTHETRPRLVHGEWGAGKRGMGTGKSRGTGEYPV